MDDAMQEASPHKKSQDKNNYCSSHFSILTLTKKYLCKQNLCLEARTQTVGCHRLALG